MRPLTEKARSVLDLITQAFDSPEKLVDTIAHATLIPNTSPCAKWGPYNRFIIALRGTSDARGFRQWKEAGRYVKKGAKGVWILVPRFKKVEKENDNEEDSQVLIGFIAVPVFAVEDTDGEPLPEVTPREIPHLQAVADFLGLSVHYAGAVSEKVLGVYRHDRHDGAGERCIAGGRHASRPGAGLKFVAAADPKPIDFNSPGKTAATTAFRLTGGRQRPK